MWLILGGGGQLGRSLSRELCDQDIDHISLGRDLANITNYQMLVDVLLKYKPEVVVNCSAYTDVEKAEDEANIAFDINCRGVKHLATACYTTKTPLIHISTDYVFSGSREDKYRWFDKKEPVNTYGHSKSCGEEQVLFNAGHLSKIVRTAWLYSEFGNNFVKSMVRSALRNSEVTVATDQIGTPTSATELARFIIDLHTKGAKENTIYHGVGFGSVPRFDLVKEIYGIVGADKDLVKPGKKSDFASKAQRPDKIVLENSTMHGGIDIPMRGWYYQLKAALPAIIEAVQKELHEGHTTTN